MWRIFWDNLNKSFAAISAFILFVFTLISFTLEHSFNIKLGYIVLGLSIFCILVLASVLVSVELNSKYRSEKSKEPKTYAPIFDVINMNGTARDQRAKAVCLIKPSKFFQNGNLVSFYYNYQEDLEYLIGFWVGNE
jgi:hypothetical protein